MARQLEVQLSFSANTSQAAAELQKLQKQLDELTAPSSVGGKELPITASIVEAQTAASKLAIALQNATNADTGKLNLSSFAQELSKSGMNLEQYRVQLSALGEQGEAAFLNMAKQVMSADAQIETSNSLVNKLWTSLKNVAGWQLSTRIFNTFVGGFQEAFNYAQDLNESLNNIQIVTSNSAEQMARFAKQANTAAKELSTTTTAYTDAALIYYQQGLGDSEVKARTDLTIKAANAAGTSTEDMSDYLTAVWNSYKVGADELEKYVDVMAAIGAGTATSLEEISAAMEKVASVGEQTGISFEQLSAIIATVSSTTRQSASTVGTAFKTIFARMEDLKLDGSVDEDGVTTTLGDVSGQLLQVGINVMDANGELREMGDVLDELMLKWNGMDKATQQAVAIAIAGKRQYTQLLALMNNQDLYSEALEMANTSEGTTEEQADIYAQSWEAAQRRVSAAAQGIYDSLINEGFFIEMNDLLADVLGLVEKVVDAFGGFSGVLGALGTLALKVFDKQINESLNKTLNNLYYNSSFGKRATESLRKQASDQYAKVYDERATNTTGELVEKEIETTRLDAYNVLKANAKDMTDEETQLAQRVLDTNAAYGERVKELAKIQTELEQNLATITETANQEIAQNAYANPNLSIAEADKQVDTNQKQLQQYINDYKNKTGEFSSDKQAGYDYAVAMSRVKTTDQSNEQIIADLRATKNHIETDTESEQIQNYIDTLTTAKTQVEEAKQKLEELNTEQQRLNELLAQQSEVLGDTGSDYWDEFENSEIAITQGLIDDNAAAIEKYTTQQENASKEIQKVRQGIESDGKAAKSAAEHFDNLTESLGVGEETAKKYREELPKLGDAENNTAEGMKNFRTQSDALVESLNSGGRTVSQVFAQSLTSAMQTMSQFSMGVSSLKSAWDALNDEDMSTFDKVSSIMMSLSIGIPSLIGSFSSFKDTIGSVTGSLTDMVAATLKVQVSSKATEAVNEAVAASETIVTAETRATMFAEQEKTITQQMSAQVESLSTKQKWLYIAANQVGIETTVEEVAANSAAVAEKLAHAAADGTLTVSETVLAAAVASVNGQLKKFGALIWPIAATLAAVGVAVYGVVKAFQAWHNSQPDVILSNLEEKADSAKESFDTLTQQVDELHSSLDSLEDAYDTIDSLKEGTAEWAEAITQANEKVLELIDSYQILQDNPNWISINQNGIMSLTSEGQAGLEANVISSQTAAYDSYLQATLKAREQELSNLKDNFNTADELSMFVQTLPEQLIDKYWNAGSFDGVNILQDIISAAYEKDGEKIFSKGLSVENSDLPYLETLLKDVYGDMFAGYSNEDMEIVADAIRSQKDLIISIDNEKQSVEELKKSNDDLLAANVAANKKSALTQDDISRYFSNGFTYDDARQQGKQTAKDTMKNWNDHLNYDSNDDEWDLIQKVVGSSAKYVDQKSGKMRIDTNGDGEPDTELDEDEFYDRAASILGAEDWGKKIDNALEQALTNINLDTTELSNNAKQSFSNLYVELLHAAESGLDESADLDSSEVQEAVKSTASQEFEQIKAGYAELYGQAGEDGIKLFDETAMSEFVNDINKLDFSDESLQRELENNVALLDAGKISAEEFALALDELGGEHELAGLADKISSIAEQFGLDEEELSNYADYIMEIADESDEFSDSLKGDAEAALDVATAIMRMNKGIEDLAEGWEDWNDILQERTKESQKYANAMYNVKNSLADILGVESSLISSDFVSQHLDLIGQAAEGSGTAIDKLNEALSEDIEKQIIVKAPDQEEVTEIFNDIEAMVADLPDAEVGVDLTANTDQATADFIQALNDLVQETNMSADEMNAYLAGIGYEPVYSSLDVATPMESPNAETTTTFLGLGTSDTDTVKISMGPLGDIEFGLPQIRYKTESTALPPTQDESSATLVSFSGGETPPEIKGIRKKASGSANNYSSKNSGGSSPTGKSSSSKSPSSSSSKPQKTDTQKTDVDDLEDAITRFKNSDNALESLSRTMTKLSNKKSQLWGKAYLDAIDEENKLLEQQAELYQWQADEAQAYMNSDINSLQALGYNPIVDENGYLTNYEQIQAAIQQGRIDAAAAYDAAVNAENSSYDAAINALGEDSDEQKYSLEDSHDEAIDGIEEWYDALTESYDDAEKYLESYEDATEKYYDSTEALEENLATQRENNYERIITEMELMLEVSERTRDIMSAIESDFRDGLYGINNTMQNDMAQITVYAAQEMAALQKAKADLDEEFAIDGDETKYVEELQNIADQALDARSAVLELEDSIKGAFVDALSEASDIIDNDLDKFEHLHTLIDSVVNLVKLTTGEDSYDVLGDWYERQAEVSLTQYNQLYDYYAMLQTQRAEVERQLNEAIASGASDDVIDTLKNNLNEIENLTRDTKENLLSSAESYVENLIDIFTNTINEAMDEMESALTGGSTFDELNTELGFLQDTADEYLTEVNQEYETQKLIRTALNDLEKTSNTAAKNKLQLFIEETEELQNQSELSEYELEIQQKKYDILLAEIALEEAQNNKSQVRLQRDSEGNYNYVYTADEDSIAEATQAYEDAQNELYNYVLETTESLQEAIISNREEFKDALADITSDSSLSQEEMLEKANELYKQYLARELQLVEQADIGMEACSQAYTDAYTNDIMDQIGSTDDFEDAYEDMRDAMIDATDDLADGVDNVTTLMDDDFLKTEGNLQNYTEGMNKDLESVGNELTAIQATTQVWSQTMSTYVDMVASSFLGLANDITEVVNILSGFDIDFSQLWANGTGSVEEALAILQARQYAVDNNINNKGQYEDNEIAINDTWAKNMAAMIESASTEDEAIGYANSRIAKIMMYPEQFSGYETTAAVLQQKWAAEGWDTNNADYQYILKNYASYDTGGYTGEFGSDGKLAVLHEKELVLNQEDTQNLLDTVDLVDKLLQSLAYQSILQNFNASSLGSQVGNKENETIQQEVTITAEFKDATDRYEIEAALTNLVNTAAQYANRKS